MIAFLADITGYETPLMEAVPDEQWHEAALSYYRQQYAKRPPPLKESFAALAGPLVLECLGHTEDDARAMAKTEDGISLIKSVLESRPA